jgi:hypothetical protein
MGERVAHAQNEFRDPEQVSTKGVQISEQGLDSQALPSGPALVVMLSNYAHVGTALISTPFRHRQ